MQRIRERKVSMAAQLNGDQESGRRISRADRAALASLIKTSGKAEGVMAAGTLASPPSGAVSGISLSERWSIYEAMSRFLSRPGRGRRRSRVP
jgi:hypothetical protein